jgi:hypothetical protein
MPTEDEVYDEVFPGDGDMRGFVPGHNRALQDRLAERAVARSRGRPAGEPSADVHLLLPVHLLQRLDALCGDVPRLVLIRRILTEWVERQEAPTL